MICENAPGTEFGASHRAALFKSALSRLGEVKVLHLASDDRAVRAGLADYWAPSPARYERGRITKLWRRASFADYRPDRRYSDCLAGIRRDYPYDMAFCTSFSASPAAPLGLCPCFLDADEIDPIDGRFSRFFRSLVERRMRAWAARFAGIYLIRRSDIARLGGKLEDRVTVVPGLSIDANPLEAPLERQRDILFVGAMWWRPNREAAERLITQGVPEALDKLGYRLRLVGSGTDRFGRKPGLSTAGFVDDIAAEYRQARLVLCPTDIRSGANIKLAEALQYGCPVLASRPALEAFDGFLVAGRDVACFDDAETFLPTLLRLVEDDEALGALRDRARSVFETVLNPERASALVAADVLARLNASTQD